MVYLWNYIPESFEVLVEQLKATKQITTAWKYMNQVTEASADGPWGEALDNVTTFASSLALNLGLAHT